MPGHGVAVRVRTETTHLVLNQLTCRGMSWRRWSGVAVGGTADLAILAVSGDRC